MSEADASCLKEKRRAAEQNNVACFASGFLSCLCLIGTVESLVQVSCSIWSSNPSHNSSENSPVCRDKAREIQKLTDNVAPIRRTL